jgi:hypothetical protein
MSSFAVYANYTDIAGTDGTFPEPRGDIVGAHSLCLVGYDENYLYCLHSWGDWCGRYGRISRNYFDHAFLDAYTVLDSADTKRLREQYIVATLECNLRSKWYVNGKYVGTTPDQVLKVSIGKGTTFTVICEATDYKDLNTVGVYLADGDKTISITLSPPAEKTWWQRFVKWLMIQLIGAPE